MFRLSLLAGLAVLVSLSGAPLAADDPKAQSIKLATHKVKHEKLEAQLIERGTIEAVNDRDLYCEVKASGKGFAIATTIKRLLVKDGERVKKGQLLIELDSSGLEDQLRTEQITRDKNDADVVHATENQAVQKAQNESDISSAALVVQLAEKDLEKYLKVDRDQALQDIKARLRQAEANAEQWAEELERAEANFKNKDISDRHLRIVRLREEAARLALASHQRELEGFEKYSASRSESDFRGRVAEGARALERLKLQAQAKENQVRSDLAAVRSVYQQQVQRCKGIEEQIQKCKITAPQDGLVVYYLPEQARGGAGIQQEIIAEGEPLREGQKLLSIADPSKLQAVIKVPEAVIAQIRPGMPCQLHAEAFAGRPLRGTVSKIATVPAAREFFSDEKVYRTTIAIEGDLTGLRPGMTVTVTLALGKPLDNVLVVPSRALIGKGGFGRIVSCLVLSGDGLEERELVVGLRNEQNAEITSGLREGDEVIVNPLLLLNDARDRIRFLRSGRLVPRAP
jgi:HlyD family secretion protein